MTGRPCSPLSSAAQEKPFSNKTHLHTVILASPHSQPAHISKHPKPLAHIKAFNCAFAFTVTLPAKHVLCLTSAA